MTQRPADVPSLLLSVTCTADAVFAEAIVALAARFAGAENPSGRDVTAQLSPGGRRFTGAVRAGVAVALSHLGGSDRDLTVVLSSEAADWIGSLRWQADAGGDEEVLAALEAAVSGMADTIDGGRDGADAYCDVRCRRD